VKFINNQCGTEREVGGLLNATAGLNIEAAAIVRDFLKDTDRREELIAKMRDVKGTEFYVDVMERIANGGVDDVVRAMEDLNEQFEGRETGQENWEMLDDMKRKYNVLALFNPPATPTPRPTEEPPAAPAMRVRENL
jgi:hypothetical protein